MIINGGSRAGAVELAAHLCRTDTNEMVELLELRGVATRELREGLRQMEGIAAGTRCRKSLYHANIDPDPDAPALTLAQQRGAVEALERGLRLTGHPRLVVAHVKNGRRHLHVVWSRIDQATMKAVHDGHSYRTHERVARHLEALFGHRVVPGTRGKPVEEPKLSRSPRPTTAETQQAERTGIDPREIARLVTQLWHSAATGQAFKTAIEAAGFQLVRGDRRDFCLVDRTGGVHSLARRLTGLRAADVRHKLRDVDPDTLPGIKAARLSCRSANQAALQAEVSPAMTAASARQNPSRAATRGLDGVTGRASHRRPASTLCGPVLRLFRPDARVITPSPPPDAKPVPVPPETRVLSGRIRSIGSAGRPGPVSLPRSPSLILKEPLAERPLAVAPSASPPVRKPVATPDRPVLNLARALGVDPPYELVMWAMEQKRKLIAYSCETGAYVVPELAHLTAIITGAYLELGLTATGKMRLSGGPSPC